MTDNSANSTVFGLKQTLVQRKNLINVCRLSVQSLVEKSCLHSVASESSALDNFCAIMEHILSHRLRPQKNWFGSGSLRGFWEYIQAACRSVPHNCIVSIESMESPRTPKGKGRAWLRLALMEKRLAEYLAAAVKQSHLTRSFYLDGALLLSEDVAVLVGTLLGLNSIDFSFDMRHDNLDLGGPPVIDFTPYLHFQPSSSEGVLGVEEAEFADKEEKDGEEWKQKWRKLDAQYKVTSEQKAYLEELVRIRGDQLEDTIRQKTKLLEACQHYENEGNRERAQLEAVIIELQAQLCALKKETRGKIQDLESVLKRYSIDPSMPLEGATRAFPMRDLAAIVASQPDGQRSGSPASQTPLSIMYSDLPLNRLLDNPPVNSATTNYAHTKRKDKTRLKSDAPSKKEDSESVISDALTKKEENQSMVSDGPTKMEDCQSLRSEAQTIRTEDTHSMIPLTGSLSSLNSTRSSEVQSTVGNQFGVVPTGSTNETSAGSDPLTTNDQS